MLKFGALTDAWVREAPEEHVVLPVYEDDRLGCRAVLRYGVGRPGVKWNPEGVPVREPLVAYARVLLYGTMREAQLLCTALNAALREGRAITDEVIEAATVWMLGVVAGDVHGASRPSSE